MKNKKEIQDYLNKTKNEFNHSLAAALMISSKIRYETRIETLKWVLEETPYIISQKEVV